MRLMEIISYWSEVFSAFAFVVALLMSGTLFAVAMSRIATAIADWILSAL
jgi:hypothetical protein